LADAEINKLASLLRKLLVESEGPLLSDNVPARLGGSPLLLTLATQAWLQFRYYISGIKAFTATVKSIELAAILEHGAGCQQYLLASRDSTPVPLL
jgi:hypothetical protein